MSTVLPRITIPPEMKIELNPAEEQLCDLLRKFTASQNLSTTCRIAGGWVRDKLLGLQSNDIDIALSDMMGQPFADAFKDFTQNEGIDSSKVGVIKKNAEQSKHLEPATLRILSHDIDFVNLRSEDALKPLTSIKRFGTPLEDALRRDITINSLFYNIHNSAVEDFTGKGLEDLRNGIIRTPLPPRETFNDDPLRVLRCIRFAGRFGFQLESDIKDAAKDPQIQKALISKVKRDRIGEEISKMLKSRDPFESIRVIHELELYNSIFTFIPSEVVKTFSPPLYPPVRSLTSAYLLHTLLHPKPSSNLPPVHPTLLTAVNADPTCTARLFLAASLSPFLGVTCEDRKKKTFPAVTYALRESLKLGAQYHFLDGVPALFTATELLNNPDSHRFKNASERVAIGMLLRDKFVHNLNTGSHWTSSLLFALVQELLPHCNPETKEIEEQAAAVIETYNTFVKTVEELGLSHISDAKTLLDGRDVIQILNAKAGAWTGHVLSQVMEWQLDHPEGTKEECIEWLKLAYSSGSDDPVSEPVAKKARIE